MGNVLLLILAMLSSQAGVAGILTTNPGENKREGVALSQSATLQVNDGKTHQLTSVGSGLRVKKVLFVTADVYVAQLFVSHPDAFARTPEGALASLEKSEAVALQLTFLRDVDAKTVEGAFRDALKANDVPTNAGPMKDFLEAVRAGGPAKKGGSLVLAGEKVNGKERLTYEDGGGKASSFSGEPGLIVQAFSLLLGKPADSGLERLKGQILGN